MLELGATLTSTGAVFRVWAPKASTVSVELNGDCFIPLLPKPKGMWEAEVADAGVGTRYRFQLDDADPLPDPYSRSQPDGVHAASEIVDLRAYEWQDKGWLGLPLEGMVVYECHVGTFTPEGTLDALTARLDHLVDLGVNTIELLPMAEFSGARGWGYDGVYPFAVHHTYGEPRALQRFVDAAHGRGIAVLLDVVYNHFGPEGNYFGAYAADYFTHNHTTPWGDALNYQAQPVRDFLLRNALQWVQDFHIDGLRLDATNTILDDSERHILAELSDTLRKAVPRKRHVLLFAETDENDPKYLLPTNKGGYGIDCIWADDFHHAVRTFLRGDKYLYYADYSGTLPDLAKTINDGWMYQGQTVLRTGRARGAPIGNAKAPGFLYAIQNHDQVGNRPYGDRLHDELDPAIFRAASTLLLTLPYTPLIFMGQEFLASTPFMFFSDLGPDLGPLVTAGRHREFEGVYDLVGAETAPDPQAEDTFTRSKLDLAERESEVGGQMMALYRDLLRLRREDEVLAAQDRSAMDAEALTPEILAVAMGDGKRLLVVNFGEAVRISLPEKVARLPWQVVFNSDSAPYGGTGAELAVEDGEMPLPANSAVLLSRTP